MSFWDTIEKIFFPVEYGAGKMFGGGDSGGDVDKGMDYYKSQIEEAMRELQQHEGQGRGDITDALQKALQYGAPYRQAGTESLSALEGSLGLGGGGAAKTARQSFQESPGYQFALKQGLQGVQRGAAAGGMSGSGAEERELQRTGQGMANQEYGGWQNKLAGLAGMGQQAAGQAAQMQYGSGGLLAQLGQGYAGQESDLLSGLGQAGAEAGMAKGQMSQADRNSLLQLLSQLLGVGGGALLGGM